MNLRPFPKIRLLSSGRLLKIPFLRGSRREEAQISSEICTEFRASSRRLLFFKKAANTEFTILVSLFLTGCRGAPSINVLGSFFPGWMLCMGLGLIGALVFRQVFIKTNIGSHLVPRPLVYLCLWGVITLSSWLLLFRS
jgi:hypothetical protein